MPVLSLRISSRSYCLTSMFLVLHLFLFLVIPECYCLTFVKPSKPQGPSLEQYYTKDSAALAKPSSYLKKIRSHPDFANIIADVKHELKAGSRIYRKVYDPRWPDEVPEQFDARDKWRKCKRLISRVWDEGPCREGYAVATASMAADRYCIFSDGQFKKPLSPQQILGCIGSCETSWNFFETLTYVETDGIPTGGGLKPRQGCVPYEVKPCQHVPFNLHSQLDPYGNSWEEKLPRCIDVEPAEYTCPNSCTNPKYNEEFRRDLRKFNTTYGVMTTEKAIKYEIFEYGPVVATFTVHDDFFNYQSGVYKYDGMAPYSNIQQRVKIIGWGRENGIDYWLCVNSWGKNWGMNGTFFFLRGDNQGFIEDFTGAGTF